VKKKVNDTLRLKDIQRRFDGFDEALYRLMIDLGTRLRRPLKKWPTSTGIGGRLRSEWVADLLRNQWPTSTGIHIFMNTTIPPYIMM
jgi:hypothetical protein